MASLTVVSYTFLMYIFLAGYAWQLQSCHCTSPTCNTEAACTLSVVAISTYNKTASHFFHYKNQMYKKYT